MVLLPGFRLRIFALSRCCFSLFPSILEIRNKWGCKCYILFTGTVNNMKAVFDRIRGILGSIFPEEPIPGLSAKRERSNADEEYSDDELPSLKRLRSLGSTKFPRLMSDESYQPKTSKVRYVPIQLEEERYPNTSTPNERLSFNDRHLDRRRTVPSRALDETELRPVQRQRTTTPHLAARQNFDDDPELSWVEPKARSFQSPSARGNSEMYVLVDDDDEEVEEEEQDENDSDVVYVKRVEPRRKFFGSPDTRQFVLKRNYLERREPSPKSKFKSPVGVSKGYRQRPLPHVAKWLNPVRSTTLGNIPLRSRMSQLNANARSAIMEAFNLEEKRNYRDLIRKISESTKPPSPLTKSGDVIDLVDDYASFRATQHSQRQSLGQLNDTAKNVSAERTPKEKEYDPITIASLNSSDSEVEVVGNSSNVSASARIEPVNSLRKSFRECPALDPHWVENLSSRYRKKIREKTAKSCDVAREADLIGEINREQELAQLQRNLKHDLKLTDDVVLVEEEAEIPTLSAEHEKLVDRALGAGPGGQVFIEKFNLQIHRRDLQTLSGLNWLNDEVINFYMNLITQRSEERKDLPDVYTANTFFYPKLMQGGQAGLRRWTRKVDIFSKQLMCIPVHLGVHWCMCLVELDKKRVLYLDSMGGPNQKCLDAVLKYLIDEHKDKKGAPMDVDGWQKIQLKDIPQQMNGSDCGMFAITFAEYAARRASFSFTQTDMPRLRRKVCCEILQGKLMQ